MDGTYYKTAHSGGRGKQTHTFLDQEAPSKPLVLVPEIHRGRAALKVHLPVRVKQLIELDLHAAQLLGGEKSVLDRRDVLIRPWRSACKGTLLNGSQ